MSDLIDLSSEAGPEHFSYRCRPWRVTPAWTARW